MINSDVIARQWEVGSFKKSTEQQFNEIEDPQSTFDLYIYKRGIKNIMVKVLNPIKTRHCWRIKEIEISQFQQIRHSSKNYSTHLRKTQVIKFDGEMIFTLLDRFNEMLCREIREYVQEISYQLETWNYNRIDDVYGVSEKSESRMGFKTSFLQIKSVLFPDISTYYYQYHKIFGNTNEQLLDFQEEQNIIGDSNFSQIFQQLVVEKQSKRSILQTEKKKSYYFEK